MLLSSGEGKRNSLMNTFKKQTPNKECKEEKSMYIVFLNLNRRMTVLKAHFKC